MQRTRIRKPIQPTPAPRRQAAKPVKSPDGPAGRAGRARSKPAGGPSRTPAAPPAVQDVLNSPGRPLDPKTRADLEPRLGFDFGQVRVHTDAAAAESAGAVNAQAYTVGGHVVFGAHQYAPDSPSGRELLAHELIHTQQQGGSTPPMRNPAGTTPAGQQPAGSAPAEGLPVSAPGERSEREADGLAAGIRNGSAPAAGKVSPAGPQIARKPAEPFTVEEKILAEVSKKVAADGMEAKHERLKALFASVPASKAQALYNRLNKGAKGDAFAVYFSQNLSDEMRAELLGILQEKFDSSKKEAAAEKKPEGEPKKEPAGEPDLSQRLPADIMRDEKYIDNHMVSMNFYADQVAVIHYDDGSQLRIGLVPEYIQPPVEGVDFRTQRSEHIPLDAPERGKLGYVPRGKEALMQVPDKMTFEQALEKLTRVVTFKRDAASQRIVPTQINSITAPRLCQALRDTEAEFVKEFDAFAAGGKKVSEKAKLVVEIAGFLPAGGGVTKALEAKAASRAAAAAGEGLVARLAKKLADALAKGGLVGEIAEEGVSLGNVLVTKEGSALAVRYAFIENVGRVVGQGRMMQVALEGAAMQAARQAGLKEAQVIVQTIVNPKWAAYLESIGYTKVVVNKAGEIGFEGVWMKVLKLAE